MKKPPCYKCDRRQVGCHSGCEGYKEWLKETEAEREYMKSLVSVKRGEHERGTK